MTEEKILADRFEANRGHLRAVAYRMLGSRAEAEDAVQEAWLRLSRSDTTEVANLGGWLTTVTARVCLDMLRARRNRREDPMGPATPEPSTDRHDGEHEALLADSVGLALLVVLDRLAPAERLAFVLHDMFAVPFEDIAPIVDRTPAATRQLASRARRRVQGGQAAPVADRARQRAVVDAFLAASRGGDFQALLDVLDPEVIFRPDPVAARMGSVVGLDGSEAVARAFQGRAVGAQPAMIDGAPGLVVAVAGQVRIVLRLTLAGDRIAAIEALADPDTLSGLNLALLNA